jgi:hypothetical protein
LIYIKKIEIVITCNFWIQNSRIINTGLTSLPTPALSGSGNMGMISARLVGHPFEINAAKLALKAQDAIKCLHCFFGPIEPETDLCVVLQGSQRIFAPHQSQNESKMANVG